MQVKLWLSLKCSDWEAYERAFKEYGNTLNKWICWAARWFAFHPEVYSISLDFIVFTYISANELKDNFVFRET